VGDEPLKALEVKLRKIQKNQRKTDNELRKVQKKQRKTGKELRKAVMPLSEVKKSTL
jgi:septation ring formation regulator EzrA